MKYLMRDESAGFKEINGEPLDRYKKPLRPWALNGDGRVVYSEWDWQLRSWDKAVFITLNEYNKTVSQTRRREFETALARDASAHPECVKKSVDMVSQGLRAYVGTMADEAGDVIKKRCYNNTGSGRMGTLDQQKTLSAAEAWEAAKNQLNGADIPKIIGIQSSIANVMSRTVPFEPFQQAIYKDTAIKVAPASSEEQKRYLYDWFSSDATRGHAKGGGAQPTSVPGITSPGVVMVGTEEARIRGTDEWKRVEGSSFVKGVDTRNLVFGPGRSGTTGELLKTYRAFGSTDTGEMFKQYLLGIVIYLVGGGHHTCHEIFCVANLLMGADGPAEKGAEPTSVATLARDAYVPGGYLKYLPDSYVSTPHFELLKEKYYDIAKIGHLHGTFA
jgi:hypothetical protein